MKLAVTGAAGLLGQKMVEAASEGGHEVLPLDLVSGLETPAGPVMGLDITDPEQVMLTLGSSGADWVVNAAAWTDVDDSEEQQTAAWKVNVEGVRHLLEGARACGARLCTLSTDYVFDGSGGPYGEEAQRNPLGFYGGTKAAMEDAVTDEGGDHLIVRTMVLYGAAPRVRRNFGLWLVGELAAGRPVRVVTDQIGNPTLASDLARLIRAMLEQGGSGLYHAAGADRVSRYEFAVALARRFGFPEDLIAPITTPDLGQAAERPLSSGFVMEKLRADFGLEPAGLSESLDRFHAEWKRYGGGS